MYVGALVCMFNYKCTIDVYNSIAHFYWATEAQKSISMYSIVHKDINSTTFSRYTIFKFFANWQGLWPSKFLFAFNKVHYCPGTRYSANACVMRLQAVTKHLRVRRRMRSHCKVTNAFA